MWSLRPYPPSSTGVQGQTQENNKHQYLGWKSDKTHVISLLSNWDMFEWQMSYLFEPSVLDVELLGIHEVKKFAVLFSKGKEKDQGRGLKARNISVPEMCLGVQRKKKEEWTGFNASFFQAHGTETRTGLCKFVAESANLVSISSFLNPSPSPFIFYISVHYRCVFTSGGMDHIFSNTVLNYKLEVLVLTSFQLYCKFYSTTFVWHLKLLFSVQIKFCHTFPVQWKPSNLIVSKCESSC